MLCALVNLLAWSWKLHRRTTQAGVDEQRNIIGNAEEKAKVRMTNIEYILKADI